MHEVWKQCSQSGLLLHVTESPIWYTPRQIVHDPAAHRIGGVDAAGGNAVEASSPPPACRKPGTGIRISSSKA
jgi:hypothetical protein